MKFLDRKSELARLMTLTRSRDGGLAVVSGRRRVGKTRLLVEWVEKTGGVYFVADQSSPEVQRQYLTMALHAELGGLEGARFSDWRSLLTSIAERAIAACWRGPLVLDELPYLVQQSPELPSALQHFVDHDAKRAKLTLAVAGSSQRMMQGLVMDSSAPLFGRASVLFQVNPLPPACAAEIFATRELLDAWTAWGGIPRYWELASTLRGTTASRVDALMLDPLGPLHREPDHILLEEIPSALEVRPVLDGIGAGAHRVSEIAGRMGRPATSLARPLARLVEMGLVHGVVQLGERVSKGALYRIADPFFRMWFRAVAPHRGPLATMSAASRRSLLAKHWPSLKAQTWEELCRASIPSLGKWGAASRWWEGNEREWDIVAESLDGERLLLGEVKLRAGAREMRELADRALPRFVRGRRVVRAMFAATLHGRASEMATFTSREVFDA
jgi:AAA+ ATPase superfamily predicted ATPase